MYTDIKQALQNKKGLKVVSSINKLKTFFFGHQFQLSAGDKFCSRCGQQFNPEYEQFN